MTLDGGEGNEEGTEVVEAGDEEAIHLRDIAVGWFKRKNYFFWFILSL